MVCVRLISKTENEYWSIILLARDDIWGFPQFVVFAQNYVVRDVLTEKNV